MPPHDFALSSLSLFDPSAAFEKRTPLVVGGLAIIAAQAGARAHGDPFEGRYALTIALTGGGRVQVVIPVQTIENVLEALTGTPRTAALRFELAFDIAAGPGRGAGIVRLLDFMLAEVDRDGVLQVPVVATRLADALVNALLLGVPHNYSHLLARTPPSALEPRYVRRVEEYIAANAHCHISVADLAAVAGVCARTLFSAFRAHRGQSPMGLLRAQRFELARQRLLSSPGAAVGEVAFSCGFEHLGRFSIGYRKRFGETPTQTLRRRRAKLG
jgi:AraC-like DNA-binding protein